MKKISCFICFLIFFMQNVFAAEFQAKYIQHIDIYNFLENMSQWSEKHTLKSYEEYWKEKNLIQEQDSFHLKNLKKIKLKYYHEPKEGVFSVNDKKEDILKYAFFESESYKDAYFLLSKKLTPQELKEFNNCYKYFSSRIIKTIKKKEDYKFYLEEINSLNIKKEIIDYLNETKHFYQSVKIDKPIPVYLVWQPEQGGSIAYYINKTIVLSLKANDIREKLDERRRAELRGILCHELMHYHSSMTDNEKKLKLSSLVAQDFCLSKLENFNFNSIIEEPLAVILGQQLFFKQFEKKYYNPYDNVYQNEWIELMALIASPLVEHYIYYGQPIDEQFIRQYLKLCKMALNSRKALYQNN